MADKEHAEPLNIELIERIARAVAEGMQARPLAPDDDPRHQMAQILDALRANTPPREVRYGDADYQARLRAEEVVFPRLVRQNGMDASPLGLSPEQLARTLDIKPGKYLGGLVEVIPTSGNGIDFRYDNKSIDQRMSLKDHWRNFGDLVSKVHAEGSTRVTVAA